MNPKQQAHNDRDQQSQSGQKPNQQQNQNGQKSGQQQGDKTSTAKSGNSTQASQESFGRHSQR